jgi:3-deoxy-D-manno-octulosonic-acid transferase
MLVAFVNVLMHLAALTHGKARLWVDGRKDWRQRIRQWRAEHAGDVYWFHCASLGEFEQGRPVMERLRRDLPHSVILLTFFSPSGYEIRKNYTVADGVFYLPVDTQLASSDFLDIVRPKLACFVKYEYWPNYFLGCKRQGIPLVMVSAILRPNQRFFGWSGFFWKPVLNCVSHYFVQDEESAGLLAKVGIHACTVAGDTRFDRVAEIANEAAELNDVRNWVQGSRVLIGGSTWPADEQILHAWWQESPPDWKMIVVPHEIEKAHIYELKQMWPQAALWSERSTCDWANVRVLVVDEIGALSKLYRYADLAWIGGGFGAGIHNTLEAAAWKVPVLFGPRYEKFAEAKGLIACGAAVAASDEADGVQLLRHLTAHTEVIAGMGEKAHQFVVSGLGATNKIMSFLRGI